MKRKITAKQVAAILLLLCSLLLGTVGCQPSEVEPEVVVADAMA